MKWKQAKLSTNVLFQSQVHKVRPKQSKLKAMREQEADAQHVLDGDKYGGGQGIKVAAQIYNKRKRVRVGDK